jgi:hypothetical protein
MREVESLGGGFIRGVGGLHVEYRQNGVEHCEQVVTRRYLSFDRKGETFGLVGRRLEGGAS